MSSGGLRRLLASRQEGAEVGEGGSCLPPRAHDPAWRERTGEHEHGPRAVVDVRHRDGRILRVQLESSALTGADGERCWLLAATDMPDGDARRKAGEPVVRALLDRTALLVAVWDTRLRCVWLNQATRRTVGLPPDGRPGLLMRALRGFDLAAVEPVMRGSWRPVNRSPATRRAGSPRAGAGEPTGKSSSRPPSSASSARTVHRSGCARSRRTSPTGGRASAWRC